MALVPASAVADSHLHAAEGDWVGHISFVGFQLDGDPVPASGSFEFTSAAGTVDGAFQWANDRGMLFSGVVTGPDTLPEFAMNRVVVSGNAIPDASGGGKIQLTSATCERLEGTGVDIVMPVPTPANIEWWALRTTAVEDPTEFFDALETLQSEVSLLIDDVETGRVILTDVYRQFEAAIAEAAMRAAELDRTAGCGLEFYRSVIAAEVTRLVEIALRKPDIPVFVLAQILVAAAGAGVIGSGVEDGSVNIDTAARDVMGVRIADAAAAEDPVVLEILALVAEDMGWADLAADARDALAEIGP